MRAVAAIGGNAFVTGDSALSVEGEFRFAREALARLAPLLSPAVELLITHGNGPQVGHQLDRAERSLGSAYALPLDVCVAQTQGELGYVLAQTLREILLRQHIERPVVSLVTQVEVSGGDEAFHRPSKPVGPVLDPSQLAALRQRGMAVAEDRLGPRRTVPSPRPIRVVEAEVARWLLSQGVVVVAGGGGGIPVVAEGEALRGVEAVVDKDLTSALLADFIGADLLILLTDVPCAYTNFCTPRQEPVGRIGAARARELLAAGHFAPGSMGPKVEACVRFASRGERRAIICDPACLEAALRGDSGTVVFFDG